MDGGESQSAYRAKTQEQLTSTPNNYFVRSFGTLRKPEGTVLFSATVPYWSTIVDQYPAEDN
jgi:hypothetical protein